MAKAVFSETTGPHCQICGSHDDYQTFASYKLQDIRLTLCDDCARKIQQIFLEGLGRLKCQRHALRKAKIFCENHKIITCHRCATTLHKSCDTKDVEDTLDERKQKLRELNEQTKHNMKESKAYILRLEAESSKHLAKVQQKVRETTEEALDFVEEEGKKKAEEINKEAEDEIAKINNMRRQRLEENLAVVEQGKEDISKRHYILMDELHLVERKLHESAEAGSEICNSTIENVHTKVNSLLGDEILLLKYFIKVEDEILRELHEDRAEREVEPIAEKAQKIDFRRNSGPQLGQVLGIDGTWAHQATLTVELCEPALIGSTNKNNVIVIDKMTKSLFLADHKEQRVYEVIDGSVSQGIYRLAVLGDDRVVCGTTDGSLVIYHVYRQQTWQLIETIPLNLDGHVILAIDKSHRILAVAQGHCVLNVVSLVGKAVTSSILVKDKPIIDIAVLFHGQIVIRTRCISGDDIALLDSEDFAVIFVMHFHDKCLRSMTADKGRDALYVRHFDPSLQQCSVEELRLIDGKLISVSNITQFSPAKKMWPVISVDCHAPEPGKFVLLRDKQIRVYSKELLPQENGKDSKN